MRLRRALAALIAAAGLAVAGCGDSGSQSGGLQDRPDPTATPAAPADDNAPEATSEPGTRGSVVEGLGEGFDPQAIYRRYGPGVVTVISVFGDGGGLDSILGGGDGGGGLGSGFVLGDGGEIVTNAHVITTDQGDDLEEAEQVYVSFADGNRVEAEIRGFDPNSDVALLEIDPKGLELSPLPLGADEDVAVGEPVAAMGSPFGEEQSLSVGVVSAVDRSVESLNADFQIAGAIQTDAAINPGNSGGPLVDSKGRVIGVNQQIQTRSGGNEGVGFAVPIDLVKRAVEQLRENGRADYAYLGVSTTEVYPQLAERFGLPVGRGAWVQEVPPGGPASKAGLRAGTGREAEFQAQPYRTGGDVLVEVAGQEISDPGDVAEAIALRDPGETIKVVAFRDGEKRTVSVKLGTRPLEIDTRSGG